MDPINLIEGARSAIYVRLEQMVGGPVFDHLPQDTQPPFRKIGEIEWQASDAKFDDTIRVTIEVITLYRGEDRAELVAMVGANRAALHDQSIEDGGVVIQQLAEVAGQISDAASDGVTHAAVQHFEMEVEPA
ncbi:DUF3168 domain-containing protein [Sphingomonas sp. IW22]|uniref:tail completion protein gp17 n=1 Tax=Sphingomonas sp. IW22 TaxID=3242489 RepID=UPI0035220FCB